jgi:hypothetical protein
MTTRFIDGPAKGIVMELERMPVFLRAVHDSLTWAWDALDQLDDEPKSTETIFVYHLDGEVSRGFACGRGKCRIFFHADYKLYKAQPTQEELRSVEFWKQWTNQEYERILTEAL